MFLSTYRRVVIGCFALFVAASCFFAATGIRFSFSFEDFFPKGDPDLAFFLEFRQQFESDDNFMLIAVRREEGAFEQAFLLKVRELTNAARRLPHIKSAFSITRFSYPLVSSLFTTTIPAVHLDEPERLPRDREKALSDERLVNNLVSADGKTLVVALKTKDTLSQADAEELTAGLQQLMGKLNFEEYHLLGKAYFQAELVNLQIKEFLISSLVSALLVVLMMSLIFRRFWGVVVSAGTILAGMFIFAGILGLWGRELDALSAMYPVIMIIVGTGDVMHLMTKYIAELQEGYSRNEALRRTIREIGIALLLTCLTTAIGFVSLLYSKIIPIRNFGINCAIGVVIAYATTMILGSTLLSAFRAEQLVSISKTERRWGNFMLWFYNVTRRRPLWVVAAGLLVLVMSVIGVMRVSTDYKIEESLPDNSQVTEDFRFFEREFSGFRPFEIAVIAQDTFRADDYAVLKTMAALETHLRTFPAIRSISSPTIAYKSLHRAHNGDRRAAYLFSPDTSDYYRYTKQIKRLPNEVGDVLYSKDRKKARIAARVLDVGGDSIQAIAKSIQRWAAENADSNVVRFRQTGTGVIVDKNSEYVRLNLFQGLGTSVLMVALIMALIYRNFSIILVAMFSNLFPLFIGGAFLGYMGIKLEAGIAFVFGIIYGIAVDDTVHFLGRFRLCRLQGMKVEEAIRTTYLETGKAIVLTTIILFASFSVLLFSDNPVTRNVGGLISLTLFTALFADLFFNPILLRVLIKDQKERGQLN